MHIKLNLYLLAVDSLNLACEIIDWI